MRNILLILLISISSCNEPVSNKKDQSVNDQKPTATVQLADLNGQPVSLEQFNGKTVFINFWATWCKPCIQEMPSIESAQKVLSKEGVVFLLASNETPAEINAFKLAHKFDLNYLQVVNIEELNIEALPTTYIYNPNGKKVFAETGYRKWDDSINIEMIRKIRNQK